MNINVSNFRQEVPRFRLSNLAFEELSAPKTIDRTRDCSPTVSEEIRNIRSLIDHGNHVVILDGFERAQSLHVAYVAAQAITPPLSV